MSMTRGLTWIIRTWIVIIIACMVLTLMMLLSGCASIQTTDCVRNAHGRWVCLPKN